jgi:hypothetical protein
MLRKKAGDFPPEVLKLFDGYVHGTLNRRPLPSRSPRTTPGSRPNI